MPTSRPASKTASSSSKAKKPATQAKPRGANKADESPDAIALLTDDHKQVKKLFKDYEKLVKDEAAAADRQQLALQICTMLTVHATIEEEIFYPAAREVLSEQDLLDEAVVEHATAKELIAQIQSMSPDEELYDAKVRVLGEYIEHHVKEEETEMFPKVKKALHNTDGGADIDQLGDEMAARKEELMDESQDPPVH